VEETKKGATSSGGPGSAAVLSPVLTPAAPRSEAAGPAKRRQRLAGDAEKGPGTTRMRVRRDANELKFEAIRALSNLTEGGRFFLLVEGPEGKKETINCWN